MVIYHLGFPFSSYLAANVFPGARVIECQPLEDKVSAIMRRVGRNKEFLFHIDLTVQDRVPLIRLALIRRLTSEGVKLHNAVHDDQRKRLLQKISAQLGFPSLTAPKRGDPDEKLVVKADLNVGGGPERRTVRRFPGLPLPPLPTRVCSPFEYYATTRREIPDDVWSDETLQIEKCILNPRGIVLRTFWNQGKGVVSIIENPHEIIKKRNGTCPRWNFSEPVDALTDIAFSRMRVYAEHLDVSLVAADWVVDEKGMPYLVDLNLTPQWAAIPAHQPSNMTPAFPMYDIPAALRHRSRSRLQRGKSRKSSFARPLSRVNYPDDMASGLRR